MSNLSLPDLLEALAERIAAATGDDPVMKKLAEQLKRSAPADPRKAAQQLFKQKTGFDPSPDEINTLLQLAFPSSAPSGGVMVEVSGGSWWPDGGQPNNGDGWYEVWGYGMSADSATHHVAAALQAADWFGSPNDVSMLSAHFSVWDAQSEQAISPQERAETIEDEKKRPKGPLPKASQVFAVRAQLDPIDAVGKPWPAALQGLRKLPKPIEWEGLTFEHEGNAEEIRKAMLAGLNGQPFQGGVESACCYFLNPSVRESLEDQGQP